MSLPGQRRVRVVVSPDWSIWPPVTSRLPESVRGVVHSRLVGPFLGLVGLLFALEDDVLVVQPR